MNSSIMNNMETTKSVLTRMVFMLMVATVFALAVPTTVSAATITVPDDQSTIQQAINAASLGDTVYVRSGTYSEHLTISKSLTLQGEDKNTTIIDGSGTGNVIYVSANDVTIKGVTTTNGEHGIDLIANYSINHVVISDCIATLNTRGINAGHVGGYITVENCEVSNNEQHGIYSHQFRNSVIRNCQVFENNGSYGIWIAWCSNSSIVNCDVYSNKGTGIVLDSTWDCTVEGCNAWDNGGAGILVYRSGGGYSNIVRDNVVSNNGVGIGLWGNDGPIPYNNLIYHNDIISNETQAKDIGDTNKWDNGYPSGGNYWSDYTGEDLYSGTGQDVPGSDGIGDTPHMVDADSKDNYPWVSQNGWTAPPDSDSDGDGIPDDQDTFPNDPTESADSDGDGVGDNADAFPTDATETVDGDGDGAGDNGDAFPDSDVTTTVMVAGCDTGLENVLNWDGTGASINDDLAVMDEGDYRNHGAYVSTVTHFVETLLNAGVITEEGKGLIVSCAARSDIGKKDKPDNDPKGSEKG